MVFIPDKPGHHKFAFSNLNSTQYKIYAQQYSKAKAGGIRCVYGWMSGTGVVGIVTDVDKGIVIVIDYSKIIVNVNSLHSVLSVWKTQQI
jgi:hypothetical protein